MRYILVIFFCIIWSTGFTQTDLPTVGDFIKPQLKLGRINGRYKLQIDTVQTNHWANIATEKFVKDYVLTNSGATTKAFATVAALKASTFYATTGELIATITDGGRSFKWNSSSTATDDNGVTAIQPTGVSVGRFERLFTGMVRALEVGIKNDGTDQTAALNSLSSISTLSDILFDNGDFKIAGKVNANYKKYHFNNGARIVGVGGSNSDTLTNVYIEANPLVAIFDTSLAVTNLYAEKVSVRWFGAQGSATFSSPDDWPAFNRALIAGRLSYDDGVSFGGVKRAAGIYVPAADSGKYYYLSKPIRAINYGAFRLFGDGGTNNISNPGTRIITATDSSFFMTDGQDMCKVENFSIFSNGGTLATAHGFNINTKAEITNVRINAFPGDGLHVEGQLPLNVNNAKFSNITVVNCKGNGVYVNGADANAINFINVNCSDNYLWGFFETSFLGNTYTGCHADNNGRINPYVYTADGTYWIYNDVAAGVKPNVTANWQSYYERIGATDVSYPAWDTTKAYKSGGGYRSDDANARTIFDGCYAESNNPPNYLSGPSIWIGGIAANGFSTNTTGVVFEPSTYDGSLRTYGAIKVQKQTRVGVDSIYSGKLTDAGLLLGNEASAFRPRILFTPISDRVAFGTGNRVGFSFVGQNNNVAYNGGIARTGALPDGTPIFEGGAAWITPELNRLNILGFRTTKPSSSDPSTSQYFPEYVIGDLFLNSGTDTSLIGWRCVSAGTPTTSTWSIIRAAGNTISGSATLDFPSTSPSTSSDLTITVTGASDGDVVSLGVPNAAVFANSCYTAWVSATDTVTVRFNNYDPTNSRNPSSTTFKVKILK